MTTFSAVTAGNPTYASDINQYANGLNGTTNAVVQPANGPGTAPLAPRLTSAPGSDSEVTSNAVSSDTASRIASYIRGSDGYGGLRGGAGSSITGHFYAQSSGWKIDESLTIGTNLTVNGSTTTQAISATNVTATEFFGLFGGVTIFDNVGFNVVLVQTPTSGAARAMLLQTWNGSSQVNALWAQTDGGIRFAGNYLQTDSTLIGFKTTVGTKLAEMRSDGRFVIGGNTYYTNPGTINFSAGQAFDSFDYAECYPTDREYAPGAVLCPDEDVLTLCTHDGCPFAMIVSGGGGYVIGGGGFTDDDAPEGTPIALMGRVLATTSENIGRRAWVCSDGRGGVRSIAPGDHESYRLGFTLHATHKGQVGIFIRH